ncbi:MAG: tail fiber domain-containing protein [Bacteroidetes bacterium]|nr:tail fiber domain-containing protein [Bacteroidota bacterium]
MKKTSILASLLLAVSTSFAQVEVNKTTGNMAIGAVPSAKYKLFIKNKVASTDSVVGLYSTVENTASSSPVIGAYFENTSNTNSMTYGMIVKNTAKNTMYGVRAETTQNGSSGSVYGFSSHTINNNAGYMSGGRVFGIALTSTGNTTSGGDVYGVHTTNTNKSTASSVYGVYATAQSTQTAPSVYGIYSSVAGGNDNYRYSGYFTGGKVVINSDLIVNQKLFVSGAQITSDERLKSDIKPLTKEIDKLYQLQGKSYKKAAIVIDAPDSLSIALRAENKQAIVKDVAEFGYLAQELKEVFPELVSMDSTTGYYAVNYIGLIPVIVEALKDQQVQIREQQKMIEALQKEKNNTLKSAEIEESEAIQNMYLSDNANVETLKLYQNAPNPFNERTTVKCYVPQQIQKVQLCVYNMQGVQVQCITIVERGNVSIEIEAGALSAGVYSYVLLGDGAASETKQMILTK